VCVCVCARARAQQDSGSIESLNECQLFSSVCRLIVNCEESDCSLVNCHIVCIFMCHVCASQREVGINSMSDVKLREECS
jgi:hypothetical protein